MVHKIVIQFQSSAVNAVERCAEEISQFWRSSKNPGFASQWINQSIDKWLIDKWLDSLQKNKKNLSVSVRIRPATPDFMPDALPTTTLPIYPHCGLGSPHYIRGVHTTRPGCILQLLYQKMLLNLVNYFFCSVMSSAINLFCGVVNSKHAGLNIRPSYSACSKTSESVKTWTSSSRITSSIQTPASMTVRWTAVIFT